MLTLYCVVCNTDWKYRASHRLTRLAVGTQEELVEVQNTDVLRWQAADIENDREMVEDDGGDPSTVSDTWENDDRWESKRAPEAGPWRMFEGHLEADSWSISYQVVDESKFGEE